VSLKAVLREAKKQMEKIYKRAPAKINLNLLITGKRADGYHLLSSFFAFTELGDELYFEQSGEQEGVFLAIKGAFAKGLEADENNSVIRAAKGLGWLIGGERGAKITLIKNLPVAAGIGGGTADAAAAIRGLCELWGASPEEEDLFSLALKVGADVPSSLYGRNALVSGIGEGLAPAPKIGGEVYVVLVNPKVTVPTKEIFKLFAGDFSQPFAFKKEYLSAADLAEDLSQTTNDLYAPAVQLQPVIGDVLSLLRRDGKCLFAAMSGSGATCFGLYEDKKAAEDAALKIATVKPSWWVAATKLNKP